MGMMAIIQAILTLIIGVSCERHIGPILSEICSCAGFIFLRDCRFEAKEANELSNARFYLILTILHIIAGAAIWIFYIDGKFVISSVIGTGVTLFWLFVSILGYAKEDKIVRKIEEELKR